MRLLLATNHLGLGGSESYLFTVAEQLQRLGHGTELYAVERGAGVAAAQERGIPLCWPGGLPESIDAALVQDAAVSHELAERRPEVPQLFVAHSESFDLQTPPQLEGPVRAVVALNDRVAERMGSLAVEREVVRLRQPIDSERFTPRGPLPEQPRRALLLSNTPHADRLGAIEAACAAAGIELTQVGGREGQTTDPREALHGVEIVIGYGRSVLEAMACGRAAYVYDWNGGDGWVTAESYPRIEADGFAGRSGERTVDPETLTADLRGYTAAMGPVNHDLVLGHHRANKHAQELLALLEGLTPPPPPPPSPLDEMARLVRLEWRARVEVQGLARENALLHDRLMRAENKLGEAQLAAEREAKKGDELARSVEASVSWRVTAPLRAAAKLFRRLRGSSAE
ncbi:MAG TPA: hypothetical protein VFU16_03500 [Solirubrobacterales bacterium]|nr:hypothetical protein [Solirubrobacterales bacterium]